MACRGIQSRRTPCRWSRSVGDSLAVHSRIHRSRDAFSNLRAAYAALCRAQSGSRLVGVAESSFALRAAWSLGFAASASPGREDLRPTRARRARGRALPRKRRAGAMDRRPRFQPVPDTPCAQSARMTEGFGPAQVVKLQEKSTRVRRTKHLRFNELRIPKSSGRR